MSTPLHSAKNQPPSPEKLHRIAALFGGEDITVKKQDGSDITVRIGLVPVRYLDTFIDLVDKYAELVDFVTHVDGKPVPQGWADCLTDIAIQQIVEKAKELNFQRAVTWALDQVAAGKAMKMPIAEKLMELQSSVLAQVLSSVEGVAKSLTKTSPGSASS